MPLLVATGKLSGGKKATGIIIFAFSSFSFSCVLCTVAREKGREDRVSIYLEKKGENCKSGASRSVGPELSTA